MLCVDVTYIKNSIGSTNHNMMLSYKLQLNTNANFYTQDAAQIRDVTRCVNTFPLSEL